MNLVTEDDVENLFKDKEAIIIALPYSSINNEVNTWCVNTCRNLIDNDTAISSLVENLIEANVFNVYILIYDVDTFDNTTTNIKRLQSNDNKFQIDLEEVLRNMFEVVYRQYSKRNYIACVQAGYTRTRKGITKTILTNSMFVSSRRNSIKTDCRKEDITYNHKVKEFAQDKMTRVLCCVIAPYNVFESDSIDEDAYNKCLFDTLYASFIPQDNSMILIV